MDVLLALGCGNDRAKGLHAGEDGFGPALVGADFAHAAAVFEHCGALVVQDDLCGFDIGGADAVVVFDERDLRRVDGGFANQAVQKVFIDFFG